MTQWIKALSASFFLIAGTLAMFQPATAQDGSRVLEGVEALRA